MISILIPVYNYDVRDLVKHLSALCANLKLNFEIICLDDCSDPGIDHWNEQVNDINGAQYHRNQQNLGRSKIRNKWQEWPIIRICFFWTAIQPFVQRILWVNGKKHLASETVFCG